MLDPIEGKAWCPLSPPHEINQDWTRGGLYTSERYCPEISVLPITRRPRLQPVQTYRTGAQKVHFFQAMVSIGDGARPAWSTRVNGASCPFYLRANPLEPLSNLPCLPLMHVTKKSMHGRKPWSFWKPQYLISH